ncbi:hypothetical protein EJ05DRAFT_496396 [Pseudovirgaria hyperparasitica]|uniref:Autophagy-related protein 3 n=1 Tax=Pseudovirgaria hyperparasitica TaxID=470096 RepID=A0A6A6WN73_9PEZI|nr:uncharacterized protein EJ05DRAFT_496396 [Pseudovirgaria hyperparasitica]KAF2763583.1 hypothetical protein EJ05DRAFT_496396 [Pseudovirgaria hyperparasitica]
MAAYAYARSLADKLRETYAFTAHTSTFRDTGKITYEEFVAAGDFLVYKFPSWAWSKSPSSKRDDKLPEDKQFLVTRGLPCHRRAADLAGHAGNDETVVGDGLGGVDGDGDGWLRTGGMGDSEVRKVGEVRTMDDTGKVEDHVEEEEIPDMEDEDDDAAIIRDTRESSTRTYNLYITYSRYYHTPRTWLSGYSSSNKPLGKGEIEEDIMGDYRNKTTTPEDFPFFDSVKMLSIHPCEHANVMKVLLDRADAALKSKLAKMKRGERPKGEHGLEGLVEDTKNLTIKDKSKGREEGDEWEILQAEGGTEEDEDEVAIRVDQYLIVFLKLMARFAYSSIERRLPANIVSSVTPTIEHDFTMAV